MKKNIFLLVIVVSFSLIYCQHEDTIDYTGKITFIKTDLGGCNTHTKSASQKYDEVTPEDVVNIKIKSDSIDVLVGLNYVCCAPFSTDCQIKSDSIFMSINDTCHYPDSVCYCYCSCYYTFNFKFLNTGNSKYLYKIMLASPLENASKVIKEGTIKTK